MKWLTIAFFLFPLFVTAQKKPLDHSVYDGWQAVDEKLISNDGKWIVYSVVPQEGDGDLIIRATTGDYSLKLPRGYKAVISDDDRFVIFQIKPTYAETRAARIKKKRPDEMPKDSIGIVTLGSTVVVKQPWVKSFRLPKKAGGYVAYLKEKPPVSGRQGATPTQRTVDSLKKTIDSLSLLLTQVKNLKSGNADRTDADDDPSLPAPKAEGSDLVVRNLVTGEEQVIKNALDYSFSENGSRLVVRITKSPKDNSSVNAVLACNLEKHTIDTVLKGGNDFRNFALTADGSAIAFLAERDTNTRALQKFYGLYYFRDGDDSAFLLADKNSVGMQLGMTVSENGTVSFSRNGNRVFFGTAPVQPAKDTTLVDIDLVKLDIWNYRDDYLMPQQLSQLNNELKRNYLAVFDLNEGRLQQLGSPGLPVIIQTNEGDGDVFYAVTDTGRRVEAQWMGNTKKDIYAVEVRTGKRTLVKKNHDGGIYPSSTGKYILLYDNHLKNYLAWDGKALKNITKNIGLPFYNEEYDMPDDPSPYGVMAWHDKDSFVYIYDRYDAWKIDPSSGHAEVITPGRGSETVYRYIRTDPDEKFIRHGQLLFFRTLVKGSKDGAVYRTQEGKNLFNSVTGIGPFAFAFFQKAGNANQYLYTKENYRMPPDLYFLDGAKINDLPAPEDQSIKITNINLQQSSYNWGTAELFHWRSFNGKPATGILYKPEDFDPAKKYPMLIYFYEKLSDGLNNYIPPAPTPSRLNISFFVSRGYLVFAPDISYTKGHPGKDAYNYVVSGAQALSKMKWVDSKKIGIQGQSWGGYQVAYLVTATNMFRAAWAGAPVVNMFSAYGGIRWESGHNRQFQYEKGQSRIGATPWDRPDLYIENSPFFHLKNIKTPIVIMSNDADGAVPWYQGIEFFTALRRLNKQAWLLNYNGEAHNLVERKNRKDIQVREQQYFDWLLKGEAPPLWITKGVPAVQKGREWGLGWDSF